MENLMKTPLNEIHKSLSAKMTGFSGWEMPVQYTSIIKEHLATRKDAGLFDVSHMGEIFIEGDENSLIHFLEKLTCNLVTGLEDFQVQYNAVLNENGGLVDDITLYKFSKNKYMICSNASNFKKVYEHLLIYKTSGIEIKNSSSEYHQIAIQGPKADEIFSKYSKLDFSNLGYYRFKLVNLFGEEIIISRTGYTGEDGFEIYSSNSIGIKIWKEILEFGKEFGLVPVGLGARDTLRLESKYALYGHELNESKTPVESGIAWIVKEKNIPYLAYEKIISDKKNKSKFQTVGIKLIDSGILRENYEIFSNDGKKIGNTTSGGYSPSLKDSIGMAYIETEFTEDSSEILVQIRNEKKKAIIFKKSFITGSVKKN
jgi:aminomethyltransferase